MEIRHGFGVASVRESFFLGEKGKSGWRGCWEVACLCNHPELPPSLLKQGKQNRAVNRCCLMHSKLVTRKEMFVSAFRSLRKVPASAWNLFGAVPKPVSLSAKRTDERCNCVDWNLQEGPGEETRAQWSPSVRCLLARAEAVSISSH